MGDLVPWAVSGFFKIITPFIDPLTREKMKFNEDLRKHVPPEQLWSKMGGDVEFEYDHSIYWPAMINLAAERKEAYRERWIRRGKRIGENEEYLKGGLEVNGVVETDMTIEQVNTGLKTIPSVGTNGVVHTNGIPDVTGLKIEA